MMVLIVLGMLILAGIASCLHSGWAIIAHVRSGQINTLLSVTFVTVMMILVTAFDPSTLQLLTEERYATTLLRGTFEELVKVSGLLMFATIPMSDKGKLSLSTGNPIWFLALLIATYENIQVWSPPVITSVAVIAQNNYVIPAHIPAVHHYGVGGLFLLAVTGAARYFVHFYLTFLAITCWQRGAYVLFTFTLTVHGLFNVAGLAIAVHASSPLINIALATILFIFGATILALVSHRLTSIQERLSLTASNHDCNATENSK